MRDFEQLEWNSAVEEDCRQLVRLALREDLDRWHDWTTLALVPPEATGRAAVVARQEGTICGLRAAALALAEMDSQAAFEATASDGQHVAQGATVAHVSGPARTLLTAERTLLNFVGHLSGVASLAARYQAAVAGTGARIYDTRKTTPGWRRLEKYAVHCGGGHNHRTGLFDAILIKDNHLAWGASATAGRFSPAEAVVRARQFLAGLGANDPRAAMLVEVEVDTLAQFDEVLTVGPDIVLLDNMPPELLREAVAKRNRVAPNVELEASGGVNLSTVRSLAEAGVDRISPGALTHSATWFDVGLDWES